MPFSVLMSVYHRDQPAHFARALESVTADQTLRPDQLVLVRDGQVGPELTRVIDAALDGSAVAGVPVSLLPLSTNGGLARALELGLADCEHQIVARADADDVSLPQRFERQIPLVAGADGDGAGQAGSGPGLDLLGSAIAEFSDDETHPGTVRAYPADRASIAELARFRDPINHPTVVYRKDAVARAGGYRELAKMEDYWLFARMIMDGARIANLPEPLVLYRVGAGAYQRRGGWSMLASELALQREFISSGFVSPAVGVRNLVLRGGYRLVPTWLRRPLYRTATSTGEPS